LKPKKPLSDIHYSLRTSGRDIKPISLEDIIEFGTPVEKRNRFSKTSEKEIKAFLFNNDVHILSSNLKKRITVVPFSNRKWKKNSKK